MSDKIIRLRRGRLGRLRPGHPWIYKEQFLKIPPVVKPGDIASIVDNNGKFIGRGYYNPASEIAARILTFSDESIDKRFFDTRIVKAAEKRKDILSQTDAARIVFSEADALPGLIVDLYAGTAVFQVLTLGMEKLKGILVESLRDILKPKYIYEKSESPYRGLEGLKNISKWWGSNGKNIIEIFEGKARFLVDIENGHKTGFYLDQRRSRMSIGAFSRGKKVLDLFCYTGSFAITAALDDASGVHGIDIKKEWLEMAVENAKLNNVSSQAKFTEGDAFEVLKNIYNSGEKFDIIILDPPSFVRHKDKIVSASKGYKELNLIAMKVLNEKGILATFSCSHSMSGDIFSAILKESAASSGKDIKILKRCHQDQDHPIIKAIPETEYLKGYFLEVTSHL